MPSKAEIAQAVDGVIERFVARADASLTLRDPRGRARARELLELLADADRDLERRLQREAERFGGRTARATGATMEQYQAQIQAVTARVQERLGGVVTGSATDAAAESVRRTSTLMTRLEQRFTGIARPIRLDEAVSLRLQPSLLNRHATSVDRYGESMIRTFRREMSAGILAGDTQHQLMQRLVGLAGPRGDVSLRAVEMQPGMVVRLAEEFIPEGLFVRYRSWAWRIVRTETAHAQNAAAVESIVAARDEFPDMQKKILATFDNRTAADSVAVHGQVRPVDQPFEDGAGRVYMYPPARPNDREVVIPWRPAWTNTDHTRPPTLADMEAATQVTAPERVEARARATRERRRQTAERRAAEMVEGRMPRRRVQAALERNPAPPRPPAPRRR